MATHKPPMPLVHALHILANVHTQDDSLIGFAVSFSARPEEWSGCSGADYVAAWEAVRYAIGLQTLMDRPE